MVRATTTQVGSGVRAIPEGYHGVTPILSCSDTAKEIEFLKRAFGAEERCCFEGEEGRGVMHAEVKIGDSVIMLGDTHPELGCKSAKDLGGSPASFFLYVQDVDAAFARATKAGAVVKQPVQDMFWGDRAGTVECPEGFGWTLATHVRELTPEQIREGQRAWLESAKAGARG
jgi:PhnB protein